MSLLKNYYCSKSEGTFSKALERGCTIPLKAYHYIYYLNNIFVPYNTYTDVDYIEQQTFYLYEALKQSCINKKEEKRLYRIYNIITAHVPYHNFKTSKQLFKIYEDWIWMLDKIGEVESTIDFSLWLSLYCVYNNMKVSDLSNHEIFELNIQRS